MLASPKIYGNSVDMSNAGNLSLLDACNNYATGITFNQSSTNQVRSLYVTIGQYVTDNAEAMVEIIFEQR